ncbi:MAG TPA: hypothetical protein VGL37_05315 [Solirubrobacteraceae bacterium]|jgi:hypothetical protein
MHAPSDRPLPIEQSRRYTRALLVPGDTETVDGVERRLVRVVLTDAGLSQDRLGDWVQREDVICKLTPRDARFLAIDLIQTADRAEDDEVQPPYLAEWSLPDS